MTIKVEVENPIKVVYTDSSHFDSLKPIQKLDVVLASLGNFSKGINEIQQELKLPLNTLTYNELGLILLKLIKDGYASEIKQQLKYESSPDMEPLGGQWVISYKLTFEGSCLIKKGGYQRKKIKDFFNNNWIFKESVKILIAGIIGFLIGQSGCQKNKSEGSKAIATQTKSVRA